MSRRTTIVLAVIAGVLAAFILVYERGMLSSGALGKRSGNLLQRFVRDSVSEVGIEHGEHRIVLVRNEGGAGLGEGSEWKLREPLRDDADTDAVNELLNELEFAQPQRVLEGIDAQDRKRFGLTDPSLEAWFVVAEDKVPIRFGNEDPTKSGFYVQLGDPRTAYVVPKSIRKALAREAGHFREKKLFAGVDVDDATELVLEQDETRVRLVREGDRWWLRAPSASYANADVVETTLDALNGLEARRFVGEDAKSPAKYGLGDDATLVARVGLPSDDEDAQASEGDGGTDGGLRDGGTGTARSRRHVTLRVGRPCADHAKERYARVGDGPIVCVAKADLDALRKDAPAFREPRLVTAKVGDLEAVELQVSGRTLKLSRHDDEGWKLDAPESREAEAAAIKDWLGSLRAIRAAERVQADAAKTRELGLDGDGRGRLVLRFDDDRPPWRIRMGRRADGGIWVRRAEEPVALRLEAAARGVLEAQPVRFHARDLLSEPDAALARLEITRGGREEHVVRHDESWRVTKPVEAPADDTRMKLIARKLGSLSAERFVAARAGGEHELRRPRLEIRARFEGSSEARAADGGVPRADAGDADAGEGPAEAAPEPRTHVLRIGRDTADGGAYATLDGDPAVFVAPQTLVRELREPLLDRELLATKGNQVESVRMQRDGTSFTLERGEAGPYAFQTKDGRVADRERTRNLLEQLGALRAAAIVGYGADASRYGLASPRATITIARTGGQPRTYTLELGKTVNDAAGKRVFARRTDVDAILKLPFDAAETLRTYEP